MFWWHLSHTSTRERCCSRSKFESLWVGPPSEPWKFIASRLGVHDLLPSCENSAALSERNDHGAAEGDFFNLQETWKCADIVVWLVIGNDNIIALPRFLACGALSRAMTRRSSKPTTPRQAHPTKLSRFLAVICACMDGQMKTLKSPVLSNTDLWTAAWASSDDCCNEAGTMWQEDA